MANGPLRVGFIGLGTIGQGVVRLLGERGINSINIVGALVRDLDRPRSVDIPLVATLDQLLALRPDVVVEAAGHDGLREHGPATLRAGFNLIAVSVGVLAYSEVYQALRAAAEEGGTRMKVASGAVGALDAIAAARLGGLERVTHTVRKPPSTLLGADAPPLTAPRTVFSGFAREAAIKYPESVNVSAAISLAGLGLDETRVEIIADPAVTRNQHEIAAEGTFGVLRFEVRGIPSDDNPRTGRLVAMSVLNTLLAERTPIYVG